MKRVLVFLGDAHLHFQRTVPSFTSSTMIPRIGELFADSIGALKSRRCLAAWRSAMSASICSAAMRGFGGAEAEHRELFGVVIGEHGEDRDQIFPWKQ